MQRFDQAMNALVAACGPAGICESGFVALGEKQYPGCIPRGRGRSGGLRNQHVMQQTHCQNGIATMGWTQTESGERMTMLRPRFKRVA